MRIITSTDYKYIGKELPNSTGQGDVVMLDDFEFHIILKKNLQNGLVLLANTNYQLQCEE